MKQEKTLAGAKKPAAKKTSEKADDKKSADKAE